MLSVLGPPRKLTPTSSVLVTLAKNPTVMASGATEVSAVGGGVIVGIGVADGPVDVSEGMGLGLAVKRTIVGVGKLEVRGSRTKKRVMRIPAMAMAIIVATTPMPSQNQGIGSRGVRRVC